MYFTGTSRCLYLTLFSIHCEYDFNISYKTEFFLTKCVLEVQFVQIVFVHNLSIKILLSMIQKQYFSWRRRIHTIHQWYWPEDKQLFTLYSVENIRYECFLCKLFGDCFRKWKQTDRHSHCIIEIFDGIISAATYEVRVVCKENSTRLKLNSSPDTLKGTISAFPSSATLLVFIYFHIIINDKSNLFVI